MKKQLLALIFCLLGFFTAFGQNNDKPVTWNYTVKRTSATEATLEFTAKIDTAWHLFAIQHGDGFEIPTTFEFNPSSEYKLKGKTLEPTPKSGVDEEMGTTYYCFYKKVTFKQKITILDTTKAFTITGTISGQTCCIGTCKMVEETFKFSLQPYQGKVTQEAGTEMTEQEIEELEQQKEDTAKNSSQTAVTTHQTGTYKAQVAEKEEDKQPMWKFFLVSILSGLLGLLMPCVFPMIPMTVSYFTKQGSKGKQYALIYGLSIVLIFVIIGIVFRPSSGLAWPTN